MIWYSDHSVLRSGWKVCSEIYSFTTVSGDTCSSANLPDIQTKGACDAAAAALGLSTSGSTAVSSSSQNPFCSEDSGGTVFWNSDDSSTTSSMTSLCINNVTTAAPTPAPTPAPTEPSATPAPTPAPTAPLASDWLNLTG